MFKANQVAPAELEACLMTSQYVADCAVIPVEDEEAGQVPKALIQKSAAAKDVHSDQSLINELQKLIRDQKARYKWLKGGIEFVDTIPRTASNKILKRLLLERERKARELVMSRI